MTFQERIENLRDDLYELLELCIAHRLEFFRCDEIALTVEGLYRDVESSLLDEPTRFEQGEAECPPRFANEEMRAGMSNLYDEDLPQRTAFGWYGESPNILPPGDYDKREELEGHKDDVDPAHLMGFLDPWNDVRRCWFEKPMTYKDYKARCAISIYHYNTNVLQKGERST
jgi:hypothetical protein